MVTEAVTKQTKPAIPRACPRCDGVCIKFGVVVWKAKGGMTEIRVMQRMKCKACLKLWYYNTDQISLDTDATNEKQEGVEHQHTGKSKHNNPVV